MEFVKMESIEQFEGLKKWDVIIVKWNDYFVKHHEGAKNIMFYRIHQNKKSYEEIICRLKGNHYFNYDRYLQGLSNALEVYRVLD